MTLLGNIRAKIWACVSVALLSYLVATLATTWVNYQTKITITHIQEADLPLFSTGILVHTLFNAQSEDYENGLLTGEEGEILQANGRHIAIAGLLDELVRLASVNHMDLYPRFLSLRDDYNDYFVLASHYYMEAVQRGDIFVARKEVHQLGKLRAGLDENFQQVADILQTVIVKDLEESNQRLDLYTRLLHILFIVFLLLTTVVINWLANREIIAPLARIKKMISDFSRGRTVGKPATYQGGDEIHTLATSFWQMTRDLQHITAAKDYVDNIINNMSDSLIILNSDLSIQTVNHATLSLLDVAVGELEGVSFHDIFRPGDEAVGRSLFQALVEGKAITNIDAFYLGKNGRRHPVLFSASALYYADGGLQGISCLARDVSELAEQRGQDNFMGHFDKLTGLPDRNLFFDRLSMAMNDARRYGHLFALFYLDLDHFKPLNDRYGHGVGDLVLQETAKRLVVMVRDADTVARIGGDEFALLLGRIHNASDAMKVAGKVMEALGKPFIVAGEPHGLGVSIGICLSSAEQTSPDTLLKNAETAMAAAKAQGRHRFIFSCPDLS